MIHDIHSHTYYSMCGRDDPHKVADAAIAGGIEILGICDHNYGIRPDRYAQYRSEIRTLARDYEGRLRILCGIEINTRPCWTDPPASYPWTIPDEETLEDFDYCLVEYLDQPSSLMQGDILSFAKKRKTHVGIAHTDLFAFCAAKALDPLTYLTSLAEAGIFWEMNVNYDSIHHYREHAYVKALMQSEAQQSIVRQSGIALSVGFDGHRVEDYDGRRVVGMHEWLLEKGMRVLECEEW